MKRIRQLAISPVFHAALLDGLRDELRRAQRASSRIRIAVAILASTAVVAFAAGSIVLFHR